MRFDIADFMVAAVFVLLFFIIILAIAYEFYVYDCECGDPAEEVKVCYIISCDEVLVEDVDRQCIDTGG